MTRRPADFLHLAAAILVTWLVATSPWVVMLRKVPSGAGFMDYAHVALGSVALVVAVAYTVRTLRSGGWRLYLPWAAGGLGAVGRDLAGILRGRVPSAEGGGLFAMLEGLLLLAFLAAAVTGAGWFVAQGGDTALAWREWHIAAAWSAGVLTGLHVIGVSLHVLEFLRG